MRTTLIAAAVLAAVWSDGSLSGGNVSTGPFHRCSPRGKGGDATLNERKNRDIPPRSYKTLKVSEIIDDVPAARDAGKSDRERWTDEQRTSIESQERSGIRVVGYLAGIEKEKGEACNCGSKEFVDYHMWLVEKPRQKRSGSMVIELSPRLLDAHPSWPERAKRAWTNGAHLRISGWRTWDQEHPEQLHANGKRHATRKTMWEIHPVHAIEIKVGSRWKNIEDVDLEAIQ